MRRERPAEALVLRPRRRGMWRRGWSSAERLSADDRAYVSRLRAQAPSIAAACTLTQDFTRMVRNRLGQHSDGRLTQANASGGKELAADARGLETDYAVVKAGLLVPWSNGQTEGQVNKLKLMKPQMYRRANVDLLRLRVLHVA